MFGAGQRILDQMRLNDKQAICLMLAIVVGIIILVNSVKSAKA